MKDGAISVAVMKAK